MQAILLLLSYITVCNSLLQGAQLYTDLAKFCSNNGLVYLSITVPDELPMFPADEMQAFVAFQKHGLRARKLSFTEVQPNLKFDLDTFVIFCDTKILSQLDLLLKVVKNISNHKIRRSIMVFRDLLDTSAEGKLNDVMNNNITGNIWLTLLYQRFENTTKYCNIISISNNTKTLRQEINFGKTNQIIENYDLEGMKLYSNTLSWAPYFMISNCDKLGQNCEMKGFLNDYMNAMSKILNFTWTSHIDTGKSFSEALILASANP